MTAAGLPERVAALVVVDAYPYPRQSPGSESIARWVADRAQFTRHFDPAIARRFSELLAAGVSTRADLQSMWQAVTCPALVVRGSESEVLPESTARAMLADQPRARLETIPGVGHGIPHSHPAPLAAALSAFASEMDRGRA
jgi:pimeloyl-ACP methyl ester carboxylesterase